MSKAFDLAKLEGEVLAYTSRVHYQTRLVDESAGTSLSETPEHAQMIDALQKYARRIRAEMPDERS